MRISDWSSDVCSSDLADDIGPAAQPLDLAPVGGDHRAADHVRMAVEELGGRMDDIIGTERERALDGGREEGVVDQHCGAGGERKSVGEGKSVAVRVERGGTRIM